MSKLYTGKVYTGAESLALWDAAGAPELRRFVCEYDDHTRVEYVGALGKWTLIDAAPDPVADLVSAAPDLAASVEHWEAHALAAEAEAAHLRNVLLVERGEGVPPEGGWVAGRNCFPWQRLHVVRGRGKWTCRIEWSARHREPWSIPCEEGHIGVEGRFATAYEAMEAANAEIRRRS